MKTANSLQERTDAKLRYARMYLNELRAREPLNGDDFNRAHEESFLFHLLGVKDTFKAELTKTKGKASTEFLTVKNLSEPWFEKARAMRITARTIKE